MDPNSFCRVKEELARHFFSDDKARAIAMAQGCFFPGQVAEIMRDFGPTDDDKMKGLHASVGKMTPTTCQESFPIVQCIAFNGTKVQVIQVIANARKFTDPMNYAVFFPLLPNQSHRTQVQQTMDIIIRGGVPPNPYPHGLPSANKDKELAYKAAVGAVDLTVGACKFAGKVLNAGVSMALPSQRHPGAVVRGTTTTTVINTTYPAQHPPPHPYPQQPPPYPQQPPPPGYYQQPPPPYNYPQQPGYYPQK